MKSFFHSSLGHKTFRNDGQTTLIADQLSHYYHYFNSSEPENFHPFIQYKKKDIDQRTNSSPNTYYLVSFVMGDKARRLKLEAHRQGDNYFFYFRCAMMVIGQQNFLPPCILYDLAFNFCSLPLYTTTKHFMPFSILGPQFCCPTQQVSLQHSACLETETFDLKNLTFGLQISFETAQRLRKLGLQMLGSNSNLKIENQGLSL